MSQYPEIVHNRCGALLKAAAGFLLVAFAATVYAQQNYRLVWSQQVQVGRGANSVTLDLRNATPIN